uniref:Thyroid hormone receptor interactor 4 n=1 Tax=Sinocyclocheilus rhinocerous TaxID=307959 RepID=A0A673GQ15_9TELE
SHSFIFTMTDSLLRWTVDKLKKVSKISVFGYILSIDNADEIVEYVGDLLQGTEGNEGFYLLLLLFYRSFFKSTKQPLYCLIGASSCIVIYLFSVNKGILYEMSTPEGLDTATKDTQKKSKRKGRNKQEIVTVCQAEPEPVKTPIDLMKNSSSSSVKKKSKFVNLYAQEGRDNVWLRNTDNNCLSCGWIVCEQEGSGPCLFCGSLVCTTEEQEILQRDSNKSQKLRKKLMGEGTEREYLPHQEARMKASLEKAVKHKDKLLEFDKNSVKRTQVLDDESDYFATDSNQWLSPGEREALRKREEDLWELRHASHKDRKITLDFAGRRVLDEGENLTPYYQKFDETVKAINTGSFGQTPKHSVSTDRQHLRELVNPDIMQAAPEWVDVSGRGTSRKSSSKTVSGTQKSERSRLRLQDKELQEISDGGWCLSMHQPWASLLVKGIKRVEGRMWYTSHRGRLWIAAAANRPAPQEIAEVEAMHRHIYKEGFPTEYPTDCLLGCVNVTDCLSQEQFREQVSDFCCPSWYSSIQNILFPLKCSELVFVSKHGILCLNL